MEKECVEPVVELALSKVKTAGRTYFDNPQNETEVSELLKNPRHADGLIRGLNFEDTGLKQPCTVLALMLKMGKKHPRQTLETVKAAIKSEAAPLHYLCELYYKIHRHDARRKI